MDISFPELKIVATKSTNDWFGEIAIEQKMPRTATAVTRTECHFAILSYDSY